MLKKNDRFTVGNANNVGQDDLTGYGNGYLKYPISLISMDEYVDAGAIFGNQNEYFYIVPVINIRSDVNVSGTGTMQDPYVFTLS